MDLGENREESVLVQLEGAWRSMVVATSTKQCGPKCAKGLSVYLRAYSLFGPTESLEQLYIIQFNTIIAIKRVRYRLRRLTRRTCGFIHKRTRAERP